MKITFLRSGVLLFLMYPLISSAEYSQDSIINEFVRLQEQRPDDSPRDSPYKKEFYVPLHKIIPVYMQRMLRKKNNNKTPLSFDGLDRDVDLRNRDTRVLTQVGGRCTAYGLVASIENLLNSPVSKLSESHLWSGYKAYSSVNAVEAAKRMAITEYAMWPEKRKSPLPGWKEKAHTTLEHITFIEDNVLKALEALDAGRPVYIGMSVTYSMANCDVVMDPNSRNNGGGHAVSLSGYVLDQRVQGGGYFIMKNSWGADCGDKGYQYLPFNYCIRGGNSYCIMWDIEGVKTGFPGVPSPLPPTPAFDIRKVNLSISSYKKWYSRSRTVVMKVTGRSLHVRQIKNISYSIDGGAFGQARENDLDSVVMSFKTRALSHQITLRMNLKNGEVVTKDYLWRQKR